MREKEYEYEIAGGDDKKITAFFHALDKEVFPKIDQEKYLEACNKGNIEYPAELLGMFHQAFVSVYGNNPITQADAEWIICPAVLRSKATGQILIGLVELDLSSSGEHWGTNFLTPYAMYNPDEDRIGIIPKYMHEVFGSYDYYYTPDIPGDIHVNWEHCPQNVREMIDDVRACVPEQNGGLELT
jgi:hypothetical protein